MRRWEFVGGKSEKFWEAGLDGTAVTSRYGRIGTNGQTTVKEFDSPAKAESYLHRVIAEKEKKGYAEVAGTQAIPATAPKSPRDEETFELPGSWRRVLHPRHGGMARPPAAVEKDAGREAAHWVRECAAFFPQVLHAPGTDPRLAEEARAHLDGHETPLGAALVAEMTVLKLNADRSRFADAWVAEHGLVFAARALAALAEVTVEWPPGHHRGSAPAIRPRTAGEPLGWRWMWQPAAERLRALLACAGERDYREVVAALAHDRGGAARRLVVSYLVPTEEQWVDECCAAPPAGGHETSADRTLLLGALGSADQVAALGPLARFGWGQWSLDVLATTAEGVGTGIAPMLVLALDNDSGGADARRLALGVLSRVPTDEAFQMMLDRVDDEYVQPALLEAMRRYPVRALRLLAGIRAPPPGGCWPVTCSPSPR